MMPTGYTAPIAEGQDIDFPTFAMRCARAFGALVEMREESLDAEVPKCFAASGHHKAEEHKARAELDRLQGLSLDQIKAEWREAVEQQKAAAAEREVKRANQERRYRDMLQKVRDWRPPTGEHVGLKDFMENQLTESIDFDCHVFKSAPIGQPDEWHAKRIEAAIRSVTYHTEEHLKEMDRNQKRNRWVADLRASLG